FHSKKSFRVNFPKGTDFGGRTEINLLASLADPTDLLEDFFYDVMAQTRVIAPFARKVELRVNGTYYGLMTDVESVSSKRFLQSHGIDPAATIYRTAGYFDFHMLSSQQDWAKAFDQDTNKKTPDLVPPIEFVKAINRTPPDQFASWLSARMDVDEYVNYLVGNALISNDYIQHSRSYLIYEPQRQFWTFVPWDLNNSAMISWNETWGADIVVKPAYAQFTPVPFTAFEFAYRPLGHDDSPRWGVLSTRVLQTPELRAKFIARLQEALNTTFTPDVMNPYIDKLYAQIEPSALADPYVNATLFKGGPAWLKQYVADRRQFLLSQIPALQALGHSGLTINEIGPSFVELHNATSAPYDLSGFYMSNDLHVPQHYTFPKGTVIPAGGFLVVKQVEVSASGGEAGLFKPTTLEQGLAGDSGVIDLVYYGPLAAGTSYARTPAGSDTWAAQDSPTPGS
ncbi:MAG: CotH kinase family protein, partial [Chloroflexi bacterium]|nr:CotH kinase family protein [Chloroflexota bacterium]